MPRVLIVIGIATACLLLGETESISEAGVCPSLLQESKRRSVVPSQVGSCPGIMQRLQALHSSTLLDACKSALEDAALCLQAVEQLRRGGKPCDVLSPVWGQLQDRSRVLLLERRSRKRMNSVSKGSHLEKHGDGNQKGGYAHQTSGGNETNGDNTTKRSDSANQSSKGTSTGSVNGTKRSDSTHSSSGSNSTGSDDGSRRRRRRRRKTSEDAEQEVWDYLLRAKSGYDHAITEPIPQKPSQNVSNASGADNNEDQEDAAPTSGNDAANNSSSNATL